MWATTTFDSQHVLCCWSYETSEDENFDVSNRKLILKRPLTHPGFVQENYYEKDKKASKRRKINVKKPSVFESIDPRLPKEIWDHIFSYLSLSSILHLKSLSKRWRKRCFDHVTRLSISGFANKSIDYPFLELSAHFKRIEKIYFRRCNVSDETLRLVCSMSRLRELGIVECSRITNVGALQISKLERLRSLVLSNCEKVRNDGLKALMTLSDLRRLSLSNMNLRNDSLNFFCDLTNLTDLDLDKCYTVNVDGLDLISKLSNLENLNLSSCNVGDAGLSLVKRYFPNLSRLHLQESNTITNEGLSHLVGIPITELNLRRCYWISALGLSQLSHLRTLVLDNCYITNECLMHEIRFLTNLTELDLNFCDKITDAGLKYLESLTNLKKLKLTGCSKITEFGLKYLSGLDKLVFEIVEVIVFDEGGFDD